MKIKSLCNFEPKSIIISNKLENLSIAFTKLARIVKSKVFQKE